MRYPDVLHKTLAFAATPAAVGGRNSNLPALNE